MNFVFRKDNGKSPKKLTESRILHVQMKIW